LTHLFLKTPLTRRARKTITSATKDHVPRWCGPRWRRSRPPYPGDPDERTDALPVLVRNSPFVDPVAAPAQSPERTWRWPSRATPSSTRSVWRSFTTSGSPTTIADESAAPELSARGLPRRAGTRIRMERDATDRYPAAIWGRPRTTSAQCNMKTGGWIGRNSGPGQALAPSNTTTWRIGWYRRGGHRPDPGQPQPQGDVPGELTFHTGEMMQIVRSTGGASLPG